jgi:bifunctional aspartokinase / homoserine dehydrogenase 1
MKIIQIEGSLLSGVQKINVIVQEIAGCTSAQSNKNPIILVTGGEHAIAQVLEIASQSIEPAFDFTGRLHNLEAHYLDLARTSIPVANQSAVLSYVRKRFNELDDYCKGIQLLGTYPTKTINDIRIFPAKVLSAILAAASNSQGLQVTLREDLLDGSFNTPIIMPEDENAASNMIGAIESRGSSLEIWTATFPFHTADPVWVKNAKPIRSLNYGEAMELSRQDRTILHPAMLGKAFSKQITVQIREIGSKNKETLLISNAAKEEHEVIAGISSMNQLALIRIEGSGMIGVPGFAQRVFSCLHLENINIILISQDASEHSICFAVKQIDGNRAVQKIEQEFVHEIQSEMLQPVGSVHDVSIIGLVGENMRNHPGVSGRMFSALGRNGINVLAIAQGSNERNISAAVSSGDMAKAVNVLHEVFFEDARKEVNLYVVGTGNVGKKLISQLARQMKKMEDVARIRLNLAGVCNSKKMLISNSIDPERWNEMLANAEPTDLNAFTDSIIRLNKRNSVLVDVTASSVPTDYYVRLLKKSVSVVACNKIAASNPYSFYLNLKQLAVSYNCKFLFETNVGAALPIIGTLNDLIKSGDSIMKIEAVLSGTLNYVFNNYDGSRPFAEVVRDAQREGYTEPDPRLDLSGKDVMRKIMILAREAGERIEMEEITCNSFLPDSCMQGTVDDFYVEMGKHEAHFKKLLDAAGAAGSKLKFVARYENGKAAVGLQHIKPESEMYHLYGKDNIVLFYTERYAQQPLVVKGAGAGAEVTASGVFADIIRTINN